MKLRLRGNSVRVRLSQSEVEKLAKSGLVEDSVEFVPNPLVYIIHSSKDVNQLEVSFLNGWITISVPEEQAKKWAAGNDVGMESSRNGIAIMVEKDWSCLHANATENVDTFPNPAAS